MKRRVIVDGMECENCMKRVINFIKDVKGVHHVKATFEYLDVDCDDTVSDEMLKEAIDKSGFILLEIQGD